MHEIRIEAGSFRDLGGWVVDSGSKEVFYEKSRVSAARGRQIRGSFLMR